MSTKIYNAYEWTGALSDLFELLTELRGERIEAMLSNLPAETNLWTLDEQAVKDRRIEERYREDAVVYAYRDRLLVQFFVADNAFHRRLGRIKRLKDYHYQNQTDRPDEISAKDWAERRRVWDVVFKGNGVPVECGFSFPLMTVKLALFADMAKRREAKTAEGKSP